MEGFEWRHLDFPERDVLDLRVTHAGKETKLMTYRWPATGERRAVVFMLHGYSSCAPHMAVLAKFLAADGFEVFAFDMRGHGDSEGERGGFLSTEQVYSDCWALVFEACKQFAIDQQRTPLYLFGRSFGGLLATNMANSLLGKSMFAGVVLLTPYYRLFTERLYEAYKFLVPLTNVRPNHVFECEFSEQDPEYMARYELLFSDPRNLTFFTAVTARLWVEQQALAPTSVAQTSLPLCFIKAEKDGVVRNDYIEDVAAKGTNALNEMHEVAGADHTDICFDEHYGSHTIRATLAFLNKLQSSR